MAPEPRKPGVLEGGSFPSAPTNALAHWRYFDACGEPVHNPGKGIMGYAFSDHMYVKDRDRFNLRSPTREDIASLAALPFIDHLHLRVEWRDVQGEPGRLELPPVWHWTLDECRRLGKRWSFRIMSVCPQSLHAHSVPEFLIPRLDFLPYPNAHPPFPGPGTKHYVDYTQAFLDAWTELLGLLGREFDADPLLDFADVSGYGKWGEWHHWPQDHYEKPEHEGVGRSLIDAHCAAFPLTPAVLPLVRGDAWRDRLTEHALSLGCGVRRDTFHPWHTAWEYSLAQARQPEAPWVLEPGMFPEVRWGGGKTGQPPIDFANVYKRLPDIGATHAAIGFNPWHAQLAHENHAEVLAELSARIGWRIRPSILWANPERTQVALLLVNDGVSCVPGALLLGLETQDSLEAEWLELPKARPKPGAPLLLQLPTLTRPLRGLRLALLTKGKRHPVRWALPRVTLRDSGMLLPLEN